MSKMEFTIESPANGNNNNNDINNFIKDFSNITPNLRSTYGKFAIENHSNNLDALVKLGECFGEIKEKDLVDSCFQSALNLDQNNSLVWFDYSIALGRCGHPHEAYSRMLMAIKLNPANPENYYYAGLIANQAELNQHAITHLEKAVELDPNESIYHYQLGLAYQANGQFDSALDSIYDAIEIDQKNDQKNPDYVVAAAKLSMTLGRPQTAEMHFASAIEIDQKNSDYHYQLGLSYQAQKKLNEAKGSFLNANKINPNCTEYLMALGKIALDMEDHVLASVYFDNVIKINPGHQEAYLYLADAEDMFDTFFEGSENQNIGKQEGVEVENSGEILSSVQMDEYYY